jgi:hypothetical protein
LIVAQTTELGKKAALLAAVEVGLGSIVHSMNLPFAGHLLSLNQGFILTWASRELPDRNAPGLISTAAALLKSLSPAGKKLTPMLAIAMQGQLFTLGVFIGGARPLGHLFGMTLLCLWGFLQPLTLYVLLYGETLLSMASYFMEQLSAVFPVTMNTLAGVLAVVVAVKIILGFFCVYLAYKLPQKKIEEYTAWAQALPARTPKASPRNTFVGALRDLFTPLFVFSWILTLIFFLYAQSKHSTSIWLVLRPLAVGYLLFLALRLFPITSARLWLEKRHPQLARTLQEALKFFK